MKPRRSTPRTSRDLTCIPAIEACRASTDRVFLQDAATHDTRGTVQVAAQQRLRALDRPPTPFCMTPIRWAALALIKQAPGDWIRTGHVYANAAGYLVRHGYARRLNSDPNKGAFTYLITDAGVALLDENRELACALAGEARAEAVRRQEAYDVFLNTVRASLDGVQSGSLTLAQGEAAATAAQQRFGSTTQIRVILGGKNGT